MVTKKCQRLFYSIINLSILFEMLYNFEDDDLQSFEKLTLGEKTEEALTMYEPDNTYLLEQLKQSSWKDG